MPAAPADRHSIRPPCFCHAGVGRGVFRARIEARDSLRCTGQALFQVGPPEQHDADAKHWFPTRKTRHAYTAPTHSTHRPHPRSLQHDRHRALEALRAHQDRRDRNHQGRQQHARDRGGARSIPRQMSRQRCGTATHMMRRFRTMADPVAQRAASQGRDAAHRARNLETHLTHGCMPLFRHLSRQRSDSARSGVLAKPGIPPRVEAAHRCPGR